MVSILTNDSHPLFPILYYKLKFVLLWMNSFLKNNEQNFKSVFTFVQSGVRMKLLKDMRSEDNEHC